MQDIHYIFAPITKADKATRTIEGPISGPDNLDLDKQIVDVAFLRQAVGPWFKFGNIREQHKADRAVGKAKALDVGPDGVPVITAKIVDDAAWAKVEEGVYSGFSVGIKNARVVKDADAPNGRIIDGDLVEVSIVDHPANPVAKFSICKAANGGGWVDLQNSVVIDAAPEQKSIMPDNTVAAAAPVTTPPSDMTPATEDKTVSADVGKGMVHTHHYQDDDGFVQNRPHTHTKERGRGDFDMMDVPYAEHTHCKTCGNDDRVCGHTGKPKGMKAAYADETKAVPAVEQLATPANGEGVTPAPNLMTTQGNPVMGLLHDAQAALAALASAVGQTKGDHDLPFPANPTGSPTDPAFAPSVSTPAQSWGGGSLFDLKAAVVEALKQLLPDLVQQELGKAFGSADLLTKGAAPDTVKAVVTSIAESTAQAVVEPIEKRLETVEAMAAPMQGVAHTRDVEKAFAGNRGKPQMSMDEIAKMAQEQLSETQRMELAKAAIAQSHQSPSRLFR